MIDATHVKDQLIVEIYKKINNNAEYLQYATNGLWEIASFPTSTDIKIPSHQKFSSVYVKPIDNVFNDKMNIPLITTLEKYSEQNEKNIKGINEVKINDEYIDTILNCPAIDHNFPCIVTRFRPLDGKEFDWSGLNSVGISSATINNSINSSTSSTSITLIDPKRLFIHYPYKNKDDDKSNMKFIPHFSYRDVVIIKQILSESTSDLFASGKTHFKTIYTGFLKDISVSLDLTTGQSKIELTAVPNTYKLNYNRIITNSGVGTKDPIAESVPVEVFAYPTYDKSMLNGLNHYSCLARDIIIDALTDIKDNKDLFIAKKKIENNNFNTKSNPPINLNFKFPRIEVENLSKQEKELIDYVVNFPYEIKCEEITNFGPEFNTDSLKKIKSIIQKFIPTFFGMIESIHNTPKFKNDIKEIESGFSLYPECYPFEIFQKEKPEAYYSAAIDRYVTRHGPIELTCIQISQINKDGGSDVAPNTQVIKNFQDFVNLRNDTSLLQVEENFNNYIGKGGEKENFQFEIKSQYNLYIYEKILLDISSGEFGKVLNRIEVFKSGQSIYGKDVKLVPEVSDVSNSSPIDISNSTTTTSSYSDFSNVYVKKEDKKGVELPESIKKLVNKINNKIKLLRKAEGKSGKGEKKTKFDIEYLDLLSLIKSLDGEIASVKGSRNKIKVTEVDAASNAYIKGKNNYRRSNLTARKNYYEIIKGSTNNKDNVIIKIYKSNNSYFIAPTDLSSTRHQLVAIIEDIPENIIYPQTVRNIDLFKCTYQKAQDFLDSLFRTINYIQYTDEYGILHIKHESDRSLEDTIEINSQIQNIKASISDSSLYNFAQVNGSIKVGTVGNAQTMGIFETYFDPALKYVYGERALSPLNYPTDNKKALKELAARALRVNGNPRTASMTLIRALPPIISNLYYIPELDTIYTLKSFSINYTAGNAITSNYTFSRGLKPLTCQYGSLLAYSSGEIRAMSELEEIKKCLEKLYRITFDKKFSPGEGKELAEPLKKELEKTLSKYKYKNMYWEPF